MRPNKRFEPHDALFFISVNAYHLSVVFELSGNSHQVANNSEKMLSQFLEDTENYDSISQFSDSTLPSEYVAQQIAHYNNERIETDFSNNSEKVQVVNIRVDAVNIYGENEGADFSATDGSDSFSMKNLNEVLKSTVLKNVDASQRYKKKNEKRDTPKTDHDKDSARAKRSKKLNTKICLAAGIILLITIMITFLSFKNLTKAKSLQIVPFVNRSSWKADLGRIGSKLLKVPVKKVIVKQSNTTQPCDVKSCEKSLIKKQFSSFYPEEEDIKANFIIATDGTVFEGRGFDREGQMTYDRFGTSYNNDALEIEINCIDNKISENQMNSLIIFLDKFVSQSLIQKDYKLFYHEQLVQGQNKNENFYNKIKSLKHFVEVPEIANNWTTEPGFEEKYDLEEIVKSAVVIEYLQAPECQNQASIKNRGSEKLQLKILL